MRFVIKLVISLVVICAATQLGRRWPSLGGLIATMPLTGVIVLLWMYSDHPGDLQRMEAYARGALWGILPSTLFFLTALIGFHHRLAITAVLAAGFGVWLLGAIAHQSLLGR